MPSIMKITTAFVALVATAAANPISSNGHSLNALKRDPGNFRLFYMHYFQNQCIPGACDGSNTIQIEETTVHDDCNGGGCNAARTSLTTSGSLCNVDIPVCDRTLQIVSRGDSDCRNLDTLSGDNNGEPYGTLVEGGTDVGTCSIDFSKSYGKSCGFSQSSEFESRVYCSFF